MRRVKVEKKRVTVPRDDWLGPKNFDSVSNMVSVKKYLFKTLFEMKAVDIKNLKMKLVKNIMNELVLFFIFIFALTGRCK